MNAKTQSSARQQKMELLVNSSKDVAQYETSMSSSEGGSCCWSPSKQKQPEVPPVLVAVAPLTDVAAVVLVQQQLVHLVTGLATVMLTE